MLLLLITFLYTANAQNFCHCSTPFAYDPLQQCLSSATYDVQNSCYICPVINATGTYFFCDSVFRLGKAGCGVSGALAAMQSACAAFGGNINSQLFTGGCLDNGGLNQSQVQACTTPTAPIVVTTATPTSATMALTPYDTLLLSGILLFCYVTM
jgi:hypothetical protein